MASIPETLQLAHDLEAVDTANNTVCPYCEQEIPPEKIEQISGKIAAKRHEHVIAITAQVEARFATEKAEVEARAKADLEAERRLGLARVSAAREEAQRAADSKLTEKLAEAETFRQESLAAMQLKVSDAESARKSAEDAGAALRTEIAEIRDSSAAAIERLKTEATQREDEVRKEEQLSAKLAADERISAVEAAHKEAEAALRARVSNAEESSAAAVQSEAVLKLQIEELRNDKETEISKLREEGEKEAARVQREAVERTEVRLRDEMAAQEKAAADANERARNAEESLSTQREALEKAREDAVNAEKAKAFGENQKLANRVNDLQRALEKKTADELGEGAEVNVFDALKSEFGDDKIMRIAKGTPGADIRHVVMFRGQECGTILYDSKNHNQWRHEHVAKLKKDQLAAKAEHAILSTHKFPQGARQIHIQDGILICNPARVVAAASIVRQHLLQLHRLRLSQIERDSKTAALYEFITSERCSLFFSRIDQRASDLLEQQVKEVRWHENNWKRQGEAIRAIQKAKVELENEISSIIGISSEDTAASEAS